MRGFIKGAVSALFGSVSIPAFAYRYGADVGDETSLPVLVTICIVVGMMLLVHEKLPTHDFVQDHPALCWGGYVVGALVLPFALD